MSARKKFHLSCTAFDRKGRVISHGENQYNKSHPLQKHFSIKAGESEKKHCLHAELSAILRAGDKQIDSLFVQRFASDGTYALAKPCKSCQAAIKAYGIRLVRYTTTEGVNSYEVS
jgi:deoxycytidylate deaminase